MNEKINLLEDSVPKTFFKYLFNAVAGALTIAIYVLADTIFIGRGIGPDGLAALSIGVPFYNFTISAGLLFGIGGATALSVCKGQGDIEKANKFFSISMLGAAIYSIIFTSVCLIFLKPILCFLGAEESILPMVETYTSVIIAGGCGFVFNNALQSFVRNDNNPRLPMIASVVSGILNIILDIIFIFPFHWGMFGAALATVIATFVSIIILLFHFKNNSNTLKFFIPKQILLRDAVRIIKNGLPNFLIELLGGVVILLFNRQLVRYMGVAGVTVYGIISNCNYIVLAIFNGISQAVQPIASVNLGAKKMLRIKKLAILGLEVALAWGLITSLFGYLCPEQIVKAFLKVYDAKIMEIGRRAVTISFMAYPMAAINIICATLLQSMEFSRNSIIISLFRGIIFVIINVYLLPMLFGAHTIWYTVNVAETMTLFISCFYAFKIKQQIGANLD